MSGTEYYVESATFLLETFFGIKKTCFCLKRFLLHNMLCFFPDIPAFFCNIFFFWKSSVWKLKMFLLSHKINVWDQISTKNGLRKTFAQYCMSCFFFFTLFHL